MKILAKFNSLRYQKLLFLLLLWICLFGSFLLIINLVLRWEVEKLLWQRSLNEGFYKTRLLRNATLNVLNAQQSGNIPLLNEKKAIMKDMLEYFLAQEEVLYIQIEDQNGSVWYRSLTRGLHEIPPAKIDLFWNEDKAEFTKLLESAYKFNAPYYSLILPLQQRGKSLGRISLGFARADSLVRIQNMTRVISRKLSVYAAMGLTLFALLSAVIIKLLTRVNRLQAQAVERERFALVGRMANGLAHELKNPLNAMSMSLQLIDEELATDSLQKENLAQMLSDIKGEAQRLSDILEDFLKFARPTPVRLEQTDLIQLINTVIRLIRPQLVRKNLELILLAPEKMPEILLDSEKLKQVLINLILNSMEASASGNKIEIILEYHKKEVLLKVVDYGSGISPEHLPYVFDTYFTTKKGGSGLGLAITRKIIEEHEGQIAVVSLPGVKTEFNITLPAKRRL